MPNYLDLERLPSMNFCEELSGLSVRWTHPIQQQGRRFPFLSSSAVLLICSFLTSGVFTDSTQQIHSLRASGVMSSQAESVLELDKIIFRKSAGISCATPGEIFLTIIYIFLLSYAQCNTAWRWTGRQEKSPFRQDFLSCMICRAMALQRLICPSS